MVSALEYSRFLERSYKTPPATRETLVLNGLNPKTIDKLSDKRRFTTRNNIEYTDTGILLGKGCYATVILVCDEKQHTFSALRAAVSTARILPYLGRSTYECMENDPNFTAEVFLQGLAQIDSQLKEAHKLGFYHGDVKWENIVWLKQSTDQFKTTLIDWPDKPRELKTEIKKSSHYSNAFYPPFFKRDSFWDDQAEYYALGEILENLIFRLRGKPEKTSWPDTRLTALTEIATQLQIVNAYTTNTDILATFLKDHLKTPTEQSVKPSAGGSAAKSKATLFSQHSKKGPAPDSEKKEATTSSAQPHGGGGDSGAE